MQGPVEEILETIAASLKDEFYVFRGTYPDRLFIVVDDWALTLGVLDLDIVC